MSSGSTSTSMHRIIFLYYLILILALITNCLHACASDEAAHRPRLGSAARG